ncbi:hypothetical protein [Xanthomonas sp. WHRI 7065]|uniref:hypothetical protein n=1 Tax=Xanthomonas sp. WHRI 7065 TaxID=3161569 RepID=UPI0032E878EC
MDMIWVILGVAAILLTAAIALVGKRCSGQVAPLAIKPPTLDVAVRSIDEEASATVPEEPEVPTQLVLALDNEPVFAMTMLDEAEGGNQVSGLPRHSPSSFGRALEPLMQLAPSMLTAGMAGSRQLMEVVINGPLVAAADGNGFRAMTMGANGVQQNARLFEPKALQNVANAAAIWQLASVAVAQKHLADISATLKRVEDKVAGIQSMLEEERAALIGGALNYIHSVREAMQQGEFLDRTRDKLEDFEIQLEQAGTTLLRQIERESNTELERDTVGCEGEYQSALAKHQALAARAMELAACAEVRLANWYMCSLYPDRSKMLDGRMQQIQQFMAQVARVQKQLSRALDADCQKIDARFTSDETIAERRTHVRNQAQSGNEALSKGAERCATIIARVQMVADERSSTSRLLIETDGKTPTAVYLTNEKPTLPPIRIQNGELVACL